MPAGVTAVAILFSSAVDNAVVSEGDYVMAYVTDYSVAACGDDYGGVGVANVSE